MKRIFDIVFSIFVIIITLPLTLVIAIIIKLTDGGRIFFIQERPGLYGKKFKLY